MSVYSKLAIIQSKLFVPKGEFNSFGKYPYRSCEDILKTVKPILTENKCTLFLNNDLLKFDDRFYVEATATLVDLESGETLSVKAQAREEADKKGMDGSQVTGASSSYARKYALAGLFCIDNEKDSDATNDTPRETPKAEKPGMITKTQIKNIQNLANEKNISPEKILARYKVSAITDLTFEQANDCIKGLMNTK